MQPTVPELKDITEIFGVPPATFISFLHAANAPYSSEVWVVRWHGRVSPVNYTRNWFPSRYRARNAVIQMLRTWGRSQIVRLAGNAGFGIDGTLPDTKFAYTKRFRDYIDRLADYWEQTGCLEYVCLQPSLQAPIVA